MITKDIEIYGGKKKDKHTKVLNVMSPVQIEQQPDGSAVIVAARNVDATAIQTYLRESKENIIAINPTTTDAKVHLVTARQSSRVLPAHQPARLSRENTRIAFAESGRVKSK
jgi:hypothetical protein